MKDEEEGPDEEGMDMPESMELPIDGILDLHTFAPRDVKSLVADYIDECVACGLLEVRIIHGKGTGTLRRIVEGVLGRHPRVASFGPADEAMGGWGATVAVLTQV